jgi:Mce-associated membrane protein
MTIDFPSVPQGADTGGPASESEDGQPLDTGPAARIGWLKDFVCRPSWSRVMAFGVLPAVALVLAGVAALFEWQDLSALDDARAGIESVQVARDGTIALLSYTPEHVENQLSAARNLLTGQFKDSYTSLTNDVVIPGAKQKQISAAATVSAAAPMSATSDHAVALVLVNQSVVVGKDAPSNTASSIKVTMDKIGNRWLISGFDPI